MKPFHFLQLSFFLLSLLTFSSIHALSISGKYFSITPFLIISLRIRHKRFGRWRQYNVSKRGKLVEFILQCLYSKDNSDNINFKMAAWWSEYPWSFWAIHGPIKLFQVLYEFAPSQFCGDKCNGLVF